MSVYFNFLVRKIGVQCRKHCQLSQSVETLIYGKKDKQVALSNTIELLRLIIKLKWSFFHGNKYDCCRPAGGRRINYYFGDHSISLPRDKILSRWVQSVLIEMSWSYWYNDEEHTLFKNLFQTSLSVSYAFNFCDGFQECLTILIKLYK